MQACLAQHESSVQRHEAVLVQQEALMVKHSQLLSDAMTSVRQIFERLPSTKLLLRLPLLYHFRVLKFQFPMQKLAYLHHNDSRETPVLVVDSSISVPSHLSYSHRPSLQTGPRLHMSSLFFLVRPSPGQQLFGRPRDPSSQVFLHLKRNSSGSLIIQSAA